MYSAGRLTSNLKHLDLPLQYIHKDCECCSLSCQSVGSAVQWTDKFPKQASCPVTIQAHNICLGNRFLPLANSDH